MKVREAMTRNVKTIRPDETVQDAAIKMNEYRIGSLVVVEGDGDIIGIITERDIMRGVVAENLKSRNINVEDIMTKKENLILITPDATLEQAAEAMTQYGVKKLPVIEDNQVVGIITASDLIAYEEALIRKVSELLKFPKKKANIGG